MSIIHILRPLITAAARPWKIFVLACVLFLFPAAPVCAQTLNRPGDAQGWSNLVYNYYQGLKSLRATFEQVVTHKESGIEEQRVGELYFKKPFLVRWVSHDPYPELLLVEREFLWQYLPEEKLVFKYRVEDIDDQSQFLSVLTGQAPLSEKFRVTPKGESEGVQTIALLPYSPSTNLVEATIWVDMDSGIILRLLFKDFYGNLNDISFTDQELDINIHPDTFKFDVPSAATLEDYTGVRD